MYPQKSMLFMRSFDRIEPQPDKNDDNVTSYCNPTAGKRYVLCMQSLTKNHPSESQVLLCELIGCSIFSSLFPLALQRLLFLDSLVVRMHPARRNYTLVPITCPKLIMVDKRIFYCLASFVSS